jgi:hypothetical protein
VNLRFLSDYRNVILISVLVWFFWSKLRIWRRWKCQDIEGWLARIDNPASETSSDDFDA